MRVTMDIEEYFNNATYRADCTFNGGRAVRNLWYQLYYEYPQGFHKPRLILTLTTSSAKIADCNRAASQPGASFGLTS